MAKGAPTPEQELDKANKFGVGADPARALNPKIQAGASMTKAPAGLASGSGYWAPNNKLPPGVTAQWVPPKPVTAPTVAPTPVDSRTLLAEQMVYNDGGGGASHGDRQGATTSGRDNWGGSSGGRSGGYW